VAIARPKIARHNPSPFSRRVISRVHFSCATSAVRSVQTVGHHHDFAFRIILAIERVQCCPQVILFVMRGHDDGNLWEISSKQRVSVLKCRSSIVSFHSRQPAARKHFVMFNPSIWLTGDFCHRGGNPNLFRCSTARRRRHLRIAKKESELQMFHPL